MFPELRKHKTIVARNLKETQTVSAFPEIISRKDRLYGTSARNNLPYRDAMFPLTVTIIIHVMNVY